MFAQEKKFTSKKNKGENKETELYLNKYIQGDFSLNKLFTYTLVCFFLLFSFTTAQAGLLEYVQKDDKAFKWEIHKIHTLPAGQVVHFKMTSQVWQKITWKHDLILFVPKGVKNRRTVTVMNVGGRPKMRYYLFGFTASQKMGVPLAVLFQNPNQPLLGGKKEDALIAKTFMNYIKTKDATWPLLFPMVKGVVKAMDVLQKYSKKEWKEQVNDFIITGSSKRGWTSWLTGAADPRVKGIAPMVIDTLNMRAQINHQRKKYTVVSRKLKDYKKMGLLDMLHTLDARELISMVDPYSYRHRLKMPKLIVNGTNDPYWVVDSLNLYWKDLKGEKFILYVPNAGHGLYQRKKGGGGSMDRALNGLGAFVRHISTGTPLPRITWKHTQEQDHSVIRSFSIPGAKRARLWISDSKVWDFRKAKWTSKPAITENFESVGAVEMPESGYRAYFMEMDFEIDGLTYQLSTQMQILVSKKALAKEKLAAAKALKVAKKKAAKESLEKAAKKAIEKAKKKAEKTKEKALKKAEKAKRKASKGKEEALKKSEGANGKAEK